MKRYVFLLILLSVLSEWCSFAQDVIMRKDKSIIVAIIDEITPNEIIYREYNNPKGPLFRMHKSHIQKIQYQNGYEEEIRVTAPVDNKNRMPERVQENMGQSSALMNDSEPVDDPESFFTRNAETLATAPIIYKHKGGDFYVGPLKLSDTEMSYLLGEEKYQEIYIPAQHQRRWGMSLMIAGGSAIGVGTFFMGIGLIGLSSGGIDLKPMCITGGVFAGLGAAMLPLGVVLHTKSKNTLKNIESEYNSSRGFSAQLSAKLSPYGVGLALNF